ncbi:Protein translocase subunit SecD [Vibrio stylophorae]|uniref:Protein translocase subunit SecD n=1 Tax=Vibrio stylophorae TaxID=659351 RepID=A0ABN8DTV7_9VIBR|nr:protein translocase subunit SecD [Vibrio stylophorae]CAH0532812.1 Protein translocase subunit SecD [Vibrio stylophorae]
MSHSVKPQHSQRHRAGHAAHHHSATQSTLNRFKFWQYGLLALIFITCLIQAIPSFYGDIPALSIHSDKQSPVSQQTVVNALNDAKIPYRQITQTDGDLDLQFADINAQQQAKTLLSKTLPRKTELTVQYVSAAPTWFDKLGAHPVKLGLDLRGGVQLLLFVDLDAVYHHQQDALKTSIENAMRDARIRPIRIAQINPTELVVKGDDDTLNAALKTVVLDYQSNWHVVPESDGLHFVLNEQSQQQLANAAMSQNITTLRQRIGELGIVEASVQRQGANHIRIELPGVHDPKQAKSVIGATASLAFYQLADYSRNQLPDNNGQMVRLANKPLLGGDHIIDANAATDEMGRPQVGIQLDSSGGEQMLRFSRSHIGQPMATVYTEYNSDNQGKLVAESRVINVATIQSALSTNFRITGLDNQQEAKQLAMLLRAGALTAPVQIVEERAIGPTLGASNIHAGMSALALGMGGMAIFMIFWYRRFGWVAVLALMANLVMQVGLLVMVPGAVLTLPGIAGLVLTVGMAVDTNVLIFERIRDKLREGASLALSIDFGYRAAFRTIFDANLTTLLSAACLYAIGSGPLQGFATTLILGLIASMITGIWGTRAIINPLWGRDQRHQVTI